MIYFSARYYDPEVGRFISQDPAKDGLNWYTYCNNNPLKFIDPNGKNPIAIVLEIALEFAIGQSFSDPDKGAADMVQKGCEAVLLCQGAKAAYGAYKFSQALNSTAETESKNIIKYSPIDKGPLPDSIAKTFRSSTYNQITTESEITLYRSFGGKAKELGGFWTTTKPQGPLQSVIDSALDQNWGNNATGISTIRVPAGTTIYTGAAAEQGGLVGGGPQVYIPEVDPSWLVN